MEKALGSRYPFLVGWFGTPPPGTQEALTKKFGMTCDNPDFTFTPLRLPFGGKGESGWIIENRDGQLLKRDSERVGARDQGLGTSKIIGGRGCKNRCARHTL
jgi:hypothetical protein